MAEYVKLVDTTKCDGCRACMVACKNWNDLPAEPERFSGSYQSHESLTANTWNVITFTEQETKNGGFEWLFRHASCMHCKEAGCEKACPKEAISHSKFGSVVIDHDKCVGCNYCVQNCPFGVIQITSYIDKNGREQYRSQKCTLCTDRLEQGLKPACVTACHTNCLEFGDRDELLSQASKRLSAVKDRYPNANIYNPEGVGGVNTVYLLADKPSVYGLPETPKVATSTVLWKDYMQPLGKLMFGGVAMAVLAAYVSNKATNKEAYRKYEEVYKNKGDDDHAE
ncbi:4Fe-4S dicluster domain-containing protein [Brevibacillus ginsengisoli]|uniref:4Fe-4S dicluster domain-containing protein n=1 Tax=Brevibacillus ginsengisoli TaxID=363854 RepID=UPI003CF431D2